MKKNEEKLNIMEYEYKIQNISKKNNRNYGIDLVRILSMILIIYFFKCYMCFRSECIWINIRMYWISFL
jgi:hypothetical protein